MGYKQLLDQRGPKAVCDAVKAEKKLLITDTTLRDAHQSLLATRMRTHDMRVGAKAMSQTLASTFSLEMWGGATFDVAYRFLHESPWKRLDELREDIPNILFQMLFRGANAVGYTNYPDNVVTGFVRESARRGIDVFRIFDSLNWLPGMQPAIEAVLETGKIAEGTICYTGDILDPRRDKYPLSYYVKLAKELEKIGCHMLAIKDMSGLLKPFAATKLVKALKDEIGIPVHLHTHDTSGNQIATYLMACDAGVDIVDCAIASMSSFTSQPSFNSLNAALCGHERDPRFSQSGLEELSEYFSEVRPLYSAYEAGPLIPRHADLSAGDSRRAVFELQAAGGIHGSWPPL